MIAYVQRRLITWLIRERMPVWEDMLNARLAIQQAARQSDEIADELDIHRIIRAIREYQRRTGKAAI